MIPTALTNQFKRSRCSGRHTKQCVLAVCAVNERGSLAVQHNTEKGLVDFDSAVVFDEA